MTKTTRSPLDRVWQSNDDTSSWLAVSIAISLHVALGALAQHLPALPILPAPPTMEVDLTAAEPPPPPAPEPDPEPAPKVLPIAPAAPPTTKPAPTAPTPAAAGALVTANDDSDSPVRFVTDPTGSEYGSGVVSATGIGTGRGEHAPVSPAPAAPALAAVPVKPRKSAATPARLDEADPCRGSFPRSAMVDRGSAKVGISLGSDGSPTVVDVLLEDPRDQGFGRAAAECLRAKRFEPARDDDGAPVPAKATIWVRFSR